MRKLILAILFCVLVVSSANAATYYISTTGNDTTGNGSISTPWKTFNKANSSASSGDTVYARGGVYNMTVYLDKAGVNWQTYTGESAIVDGGWPGTAAGDATGLPSGSNRYSALVFIAASNITWDGIEVRNSRGRGLEVYGTAITGVTVKNSKIHHCYMECLTALGDETSTGWILNTTIENNDISQGAIFRKISGAPSSDSPGMVLLTRFDGMTVKKNKIHDSYYDGLLIGGNVRGTYASTNCLVEYNQVYGNYQDQIVFSSNHNNTVRYNLIYGTYPNANGEKGRGSGIWFANETGWNMGICDSNSYVYGNLIAYTFVNIWIEGQESTLGIKNIYVYNNTSIDAYSSNFYVTWTTSTGIVLKNNIIIQNEVTPTTTLGWAATGTITADYNLWSSTPSSTNLIGANDPTYVSIPTVKTTGWGTLTSGQLVGSEFALQAGSAPVNAGVTITNVGTHTFDQTLKLPGTDFSLNQVPLIDQDLNGAAWEIGGAAYEVTPSSPCDNDSVCDSGETYLNCPSDCTAPSTHTEVYHFRFSTANISGSTITNLTAGGADGTITGTLSAYPWGSSADAARMFDGASYVTAPAMTMTGAWYIAAWIIPTAFNTTGWDSHIAGTPYNNSRLCLSNSGVPQVITYSDGGHTLSSSEATTLNQPVFVVAVHDQANCSIYINGVLSTSGALIAAAANGSAFNIGAATTDWTDSEYFKGVIYDVKAGTGVLTAADIKTLYDTDLAAQTVQCAVKIKRSLTCD